MLEIALVISILACGDGDANARMGPPSGFSQTDSVGVMVSVTSSADARKSLPWEIGTVPDLELGTDEDESHQFHDIEGVRQVPGSRVLVLDGGSRELRFFDQDGGLVHRTGGHGEGPGEFEDPVLVPGSHTDSLLIWDFRLRRLHVFSPDGRAHRLTRPDSWPGGRPPVGMAGSRALVSHSPPLDLTTGPEEGVWEVTRLYSWIEVPPGRRTTLDSLALRNGYRDTNARGVPVLFEIPFAARPTGVVRGSEAWITAGDASRIDVYDLEGRRTKIVRIDEARTGVTDQLLDEWMRVRADGSSRSVQEWEDTYSGVPTPDSVPVFESLLVDALGLVWARLYKWDAAEPPRWIVFDEDGRALGSVSPPPGLEIQQVGVDFILGVTEDELGVERVERYELVRDVRESGLSS